MKVHRGDDELVPEVYLHNPDPVITDDDTSFAHNATRSFSARRNQLFSTDREIYLDTQYPLILLNDISPQLPNSLTPNFNPQSSSPQLTSLSSPRRKRGRSQAYSSVSPVVGSPPRTMSIFNPMLLLNNSEVRGSQNGEDGKLSQSGGDSPTKSATTVKSQVDLFEVAPTGKKVNKKKLFVKKVLNSIPVNIFISLITIYVLLADDLRELVGTKQMDTACDIMSIVCFVIFVVETILAFWIEKRYRWSIYFFLDVLSTAALIFDVEFIIQDNFPQIANETAQVAEASRASRIATREGRIMKIIRLIQIGKRSQKIGATRMIMGIEEREDTFEEVDPADIAESGENVESGENNENSGNPENQDLSPDEIKLDQTEGQGGISLSLSPSLPHGQREIQIFRFSSNSQAQVQIAKEISEEFALKVSEVKDTSVVLDESPLKKKKKKSRKKRIKRTLTKVFRKRKKKEFVPPANLNSPEDVDDEEEEDRKFRVLRVGRKLADRSIRRVIVMILSLLLLIPLFSSDFYFHAPIYQPYTMQLLKALDDSTVTVAAREAVLEQFIKEGEENSPELVYLKIGDTVKIQDSHVDLTHLKESEYHVVTIKTKTWGVITSIVSSRHHNVLHAWLRMVNIGFICLILTYGAVLFSKDANKLVLQPLQRIIKRVNKIAMDPVKAKEQVTVISKKKKSGFENETVHIENAIIRIGKLLALGFGDAGASITAQNIAYSGEFSPEFPGKKEAAIFGFCDIRDFSVVTEVLQEEVMIFVNSVAHIVHSLVDRYGGSANKNTGDAFLVVWKFSEDVIIENDDGQLGILPTQESQNIADAALISFLKIMGKINRDFNMLQYRENPILQTRIPDYKVRLGFGLHFGWAIEGAMGSEYKIDASYLSANVNLASQLEDAAKFYNVPLLLSGEFCELLSDNMKQITRQIDLVSVEGFERPVELYTVDMVVDGMKTAQSNDISTEETKRQNRDKKKKLKNIFAKGHMYKQLDADKELRYMLSVQNEEFDEVFEAALDAYIEGDWLTAKKKLEVCLEKRENDGPSMSLYNYIEGLDFIAPDEWEGHRPLFKK